MVCKCIVLVFLAVCLSSAEESNVMEAMEAYEDYESPQNSTHALVSNSTDSSAKSHHKQTSNVVETKLKHIKPETNQVSQQLQRNELESSDTYSPVKYVEKLTPIALESLSGSLGLNRPALKINGRLYETPKVMEVSSNIPILGIADLNNSLELWLNSDANLQQTKILPQSILPNDEILSLKTSIDLLSHQLAELTDESQYNHILPNTEEDTFFTQIDQKLEEIRNLQLDLKLSMDD